MGKTVSKLELGEIIGRDERTLSRWQKDGMPVIEFGVGRGGRFLCIGRDRRILRRRGDL